MQAFIRRSGSLLCALAFLLECGPATAEQASVVLTRGNTTIVFDPYLPNILRVTLSLKREPALVGPRYGFVAKPVDAGWSASQTAQADVYRSIESWRPSTAICPTTSRKFRRSWT